MARIRTIKPEILEDEKVAALSDAGFRLFVAMIVLADDHGNLRADARWLEGQIWWARRDPPRVAEILREVSGADMIELYEVRGQQYAAIRGWQKHQRIDNAGKPRVPLPSEGSPISAEIRGEIPRNAAGPRPPTTTTEEDRQAPPDPASLDLFKSQVDASAPEHNANHAHPRKHPSAADLAEVACREINRLAGKNYRADSKTVSDLCAKLAKANHTPEQVAAVVASKRAWVGDPKMGEFFRPATLLAPSNFTKYLDEIEARATSRGPAQDSTGEHRVYQSNADQECEHPLMRALRESGNLPSHKEPDASS